MLISSVSKYNCKFVSLSAHCLSAHCFTVGLMQGNLPRLAVVLSLGPQDIKCGPLGSFCTTGVQGWLWIPRCKVQKTKITDFIGQASRQQQQEDKPRPDYAMEYTQWQRALCLDRCSAPMHIPCIVSGQDPTYVGLQRTGPCPKMEATQAPDQDAAHWPLTHDGTLCCRGPEDNRSGVVALSLILSGSDVAVDFAALQQILQPAVDLARTGVALL